MLSHMQFRGEFGVKERGGSLWGVELPLQHFKDNFFKTLFFGDKGNFYYASFDLVDFVDIFHI